MHMFAIPIFSFQVHEVLLFTSIIKLLCISVILLAVSLTLWLTVTGNATFECTIQNY